MPVLSSTQYAQSTDLAALGLLSGALANITTQTQNAALLAASSLVDSYLQNRYPIPLTSWGADVVRATCIIAAYDLIISRGFAPQSAADQNLRQRYVDVIVWLENEEPAYLVSANGVSALNGVPEVESSDPRGWTPRDLVI